MSKENENLNEAENSALNIADVIRSVSWLGLMNKLLFQWFFVRLTKCQEKRIENYTLHSFYLMSNGFIKLEYIN
jgi:hypothetical protein